jgi:hypothetical protein
MSDLIKAAVRSCLDAMIKSAKKAGGIRIDPISGPVRCKLSLPDLTVLTNDPYRQDTPTTRRDGEWFANQVSTKLAPGQKLHLRGIFYKVVGDGAVPKPDGEVFVNTDDGWKWLSNKAAKAGRWLGLVPFSKITDERNAPAEVFTDNTTPRVPQWSLSAGDYVDIPDIDYAMPQFEVSGFNARQPYRIVFIGEKSSLGDILRPIAEEVEGELLLPTGEISDTLIYGVASRYDGRPTVCFYFSDFDPSGHQMPVSMARKLQALRDLEFPDMDVRLYHVGLTLEHVRKFNLPSTPLKEGEGRADKWREAMQHEQTEIDAAIALYPDELRQIARDAVAPFYDPTLRNRVSSARWTWKAKAGKWLSEHPDYAEARADVEAALESVGQAVQFLREAQRRAYRALENIEPPAPDVPEPILTVDPPEPLFNSDDDFTTATLKLKAYKDLAPEPEEDA